MLGDCHVHVIMDGKNYKEAVALHKGGVKESVIHDCFSNYQKAGITFLRDGGDALGVSKRAKELACEYGITYLTPIFAIHKKGHYGGLVGRSFELITEYKKLVLEAKEAGADFIKIMVSGLIDFTGYGILSEEGLEESFIKEMIHIAHEEGLSVMAHCNGARTMEAAAAAGVDSIEHGAYSDERALMVMKEQGVIWTPTVSPIGNLAGGGRFLDEVTQSIASHHLKMIETYVQMGGRIALGSDAGAWRVPHVEGLSSEMSYLHGIVEESHLEKTEKLIREKFSKRS